MSQEKRPDDSGQPSPSPPPTKEVIDKLGTEWGDDWESAFQAEENGGAAPADEEEFLFDFADEKGDSPAAEEDPFHKEGEDDAGGESRPLLRLSLPPWLTALPTLPRRWGRKLSTLPVPRKVMLGGGLLALLLLIGLATLLSRPSRPLEIALPADPFGVGELRSPTEPLFPEELTPAPPVPPPPAPAAATPAIPEAQRLRLQLHGFFISPQDQPDPNHPNFVHVDLSLILQLAPGEEPPPLLEPALRETIYRFYRGQDRNTLQRYSLARGEMLRDLREWLDRHHPQPPIDTISFDRYWFN
ncbi:hypothetical protein ACHHRT_11455 [Desulfurivibrio sp. D14AmB]|uniref:hypothetical protein n=1 Tax=Desulfurivibrio sp. D14AmB TaxID=3374370 RepID=UPI00376EBBFE